MNGGIGQSGKDAETNSNVARTRGEKRRSRFDDFAHSIARIAVAQMCESVGFQGFQPFALDILSDLAVRYILEIGKTANSYANLACRTECNVFDIIQGIENLCSGQGFAAASNVHRCLLSSGTMREVVRYVGFAEEVPFAFSIPGFPVIKEHKHNYSFLQKGENPRDEHIPSWLPAFPDPQTYAISPVRDEKGAHTREEEIHQLDEHRDVKNPILIKWKRLNGSTGGPKSSQLAEALQEKCSSVVNPFQRPPLQNREKEVSNVRLPAKISNESFPRNPNNGFSDNQVSTLDTFEPAIEDVKSGQYDPEDVKTIPLSRLSKVQFTFGHDWKSLKITGRSRKNGDENVASWFVPDD